MGEPLPDHSSLTRIRERYGVEVFRRFSDAIVEQCQQEKLVWGKELYLDSTQVNANADLDSLTPRFAVEAREAIQTHLAALFSDQDTPPEQQTGASETVAALPEAPAPAAHACPVPIRLPVTLCEPEQEKLAQDNAVRHDWIAQGGRPQREVHGLYQRTADFKVSTTDPDTTPMRLKGGGTHLGYHTHYVVDGGKARIILQVLVTPSEVMDNQPMLDLIFRTRFRWKLRPRHVTGDTKYGTIENIKALEDAGIRAYVPLPDWEHQRPYFGPAQFTYDAEHDRYICPNGQLLHLTRMEYTGQKAEYNADPATCNACLLNQKAMRKRKVWVEPLFAEAKDWHGLRRFRLRLLWRVNCEALRIATGQNLKRLLKKRGWGRRPFPVEALCASFWGLLREVLVLMLEKEWFLVPIGSVSSRLRTPCVSLC